MRRRFVVLTALVAVAALWTGAGLADEVAHPKGGPPGAWRKIGTLHANHSADHDKIVVKGNDNFRRIKFRVKDAPLNIHRMVVTYDNGAPDRIDVRHNIPKGGESRPIDLRGAGTRSLRSVEFWYDTQGWGRGSADITLYGQK
jgi:hypothetical protein